MSGGDKRRRDLEIEFIIRSFEWDSDQFSVLLASMRIRCGGPGSLGRSCVRVETCRISSDLATRPTSSLQRRNRIDGELRGCGPGNWSGGSLGGIHFSRPIYLVLLLLHVGHVLAVVLQPTCLLDLRHLVRRELSNRVRSDLLSHSPRLGWRATSAESEKTSDEPEVVTTTIPRCWMYLRRTWDGSTDTFERAARATAIFSTTASTGPPAHGQHTPFER